MGTGTVCLFVCLFGTICLEFKWRSCCPGETELLCLSRRTRAGGAGWLGAPGRAGVSTVTLWTAPMRSL